MHILSDVGTENTYSYDIRHKKTQNITTRKTRKLYIKAPNSRTGFDNDFVVDERQREIFAKTRRTGSGIADKFPGVHVARNSVELLCVDLRQKQQWMIKYFPTEWVVETDTTMLLNDFKWYVFVKKKKV